MKGSQRKKMNFVENWFVQSESREMESQMNRIPINLREFFIWDSISRDLDCRNPLKTTDFKNPFFGYGAQE